MSVTILCADDFAISEGVTRGIADLAAARRISATSAMVTTDAWPVAAGKVATLRRTVAVGLHINLTLGAPLTAMERFAPDRQLPPLRRVVQQAVLRKLDLDEVTGEISAQIGEFQERTGLLPDFLDGHQHVHALPCVREALVTAVGTFDWPRPLFVRSPEDSVANITGRRIQVAKALAISALCGGFRAFVLRAGLVTNGTFAGVSSFSRERSYTEELSAAFERPGHCHLVMCHPGFADDALKQLDPVVERRADEFEALMRDETLPDQIWHPQSSGPIVLPHG